MRNGSCYEIVDPDYQKTDDIPDDESLREADEATNESYRITREVLSQEH